MFILLNLQTIHGENLPAKEPVLQTQIILVCLPEDHSGAPDFPDSTLNVPVNINNNKKKGSENAK